MYQVSPIAAARIQHAHGSGDISAQHLIEDGAVDPVQTALPRQTFFAAQYVPLRTVDGSANTRPHPRRPTLFFSPAGVPLTKSCCAANRRGPSRPRSCGPRHGRTPSPLRRPEACLRKSASAAGAPSTPTRILSILEQCTLPLPYLSTGVPRRPKPEAPNEHAREWSATKPAVTTQGLTQ